MSTQLPVALLNYESGGRIAPGHYDFDGLVRAFADVEEPPVAIFINEAKEWNLWGKTALRAATNVLYELLRRPYVGELGVGSRGPASTPALIYDPQAIRLDYWGDQHESVHPERYNFARAHIAGRKTVKFCFSLHHWTPYSGDGRLEEARIVRGLSTGLPTLLAGDLNSTASGLHIPKMNWKVAPEFLRLNRTIERANGTYVDDTRAVDALLGPWDNKKGARRVRKMGWYALAELAHAQGMPKELAFMPTSNGTMEEGGGMLVDWLIVNEAWREGLVPNTYKVHLAERPFPSDHRLVTATLEL